MAYPGPTQQKLTPAPRGYKPFYLSHYGRHGSRFHSKPSFYNAPYQTLLKADSLGKLTATGKDVLHRLDVIRKDAENHWGDLTWKGAHQLEGIARRMYERFPEIFQGKTNIDARSTGVGRCVLSMEYALMQLVRLNPELNIHHDATHRDVSYLNLQDKELFNLRKNKKAVQLYNDFKTRNNDVGHLMQTLFNDSVYVRQHVKSYDLGEQLLILAAILQNAFSTSLPKTRFTVFGRMVMPGGISAGVPVRLPAVRCPTCSVTCCERLLSRPTAVSGSPRPMFICALAMRRW